MNFISNVHSHFSILNNKVRTINAMNTTNQTKRQIPLIAKIAVKHGFITKDQLKRAIMLQDAEISDGHDSSLPEIFGKTGMITQEKMIQLLTLVDQYKAKNQTESQPGSDNEATSEIPPDNKPPVEGDFSIRISDDALYAYVDIHIPDPSSIGVDHIVAAAYNLGIRYGMSKATSLKNDLQIHDAAKPMIIARGTPPDPGKAPSVDYQFDTDHHRLKSPDLGVNNRSTLTEPPEVKEGDLLAEKTPMIPSDPGIDIFGKPIPSPIINGVTIRSGKGAEVFEDELKVFATINGSPFLSIEKTVSVFPWVILDKDYGVISGAVERDSCIKTSGTLTGEYPVRGGNIVANEIRNAHIDVIGCVHASMGITNTVITSQGDIHAKYIRGCRIETYGSVFVENEIMDCTILASGVCVSENSKIIASTIAATQGVKAMGIGTDTSIPCEISVGNGAHINRIFERIDEKIKLNSEWIAKLGETSDNLMDETKKVQKQIAPLVTFHKKAEQAIQITQAQIDALKKKQTGQQPLDEEKNLLELKAKDQTVLGTIRACSDRLKKIQEEAIGIPDEIRRREEENTQLLLDRSAILSWSETITPSARLEVRGKLCAGTEISGAQAQVVMEKHVEGILAQEIKRDTEQGEEWVMSLTKHP